MEENTSSYTVPMNGGEGHDFDVQNKREEMERNENQLQSINELPTFLRRLIHLSPKRYKKTFMFIQFMMTIGWSFPIFSYVTSSVIIGSLLAGYFLIVNSSLTLIPDFTTPGVFLDILLKDSKITKKINDNMKGNVISNAVFMILILLPLSWIFFLINFANTAWLGEQYLSYSFGITIICGALGSIFMILNIPFDMNSTLPEQVSIMHIEKIKNYLEAVRTIILKNDTEDGIPLVKKLSKEQKKVEQWIVDINNGMSSFNTAGIIILICNGIIMLTIAAGGFSLAVTIMFSIFALWMFIFLYNILYGLAKPNLIWEQQKILLFNDAEVILNMKFPIENFETWLSRHDINASRAFGTKVTFEKMKQVAGVLTSAFGIVLYLLLREELRKYL